MSEYTTGVARIELEALEIAKEQALLHDMKVSEYISMAVRFVAQYAVVDKVHVEVERLCIDGKILE